MHTYETDFKLSVPVNNYMAAKSFLKREDMTSILQSQVENSSIFHVEWILEDEYRGVVRVEASKELSQETLAAISSWIKGQCSDGLGESFEQQDFALYEYAYDECCECQRYADCLYEEMFESSSFDWQSNDYQLQKVVALRPGDIFVTDKATFFQVVDTTYSRCIVVRPIYSKFIGERKEGNTRILTYKPCKDDFRENCAPWAHYTCMQGRRCKVHRRDDPLIYVDEETAAVLLKEDTYDIEMEMERA